MKIKLFIAAILISSIAISQSIQIKSGIETDNSFTLSYWNSPIGQDETGYYILGDLNNATAFNGSAIEKVDHNLNSIYVKKINYLEGVFNNSITFQGVELKNGQLNMFYNGWNKEKKESSFHVRMMDKMTGEFVKETTVLDQNPANGQISTPMYYYSFSPDGSKLMVAAAFKKDKKEPETVKLKVFNTTNWTLLWEKNYQVRELAEKQSKNKYAINNTGTVFLYKQSYQDTKARYSELHVINVNDNKVTKLTYEDKHISMAELSINKDGNGVLIGAIAEMWQDYGTIGHALYICDSKGELLTSNVKLYPEGALREIRTNPSDTKYLPVINNIQLKKIIEKEEGGYILVMEKYYEKKEAIQGYTLPTYNFSRECGNIFVLSLDKNGDYQWSLPIFKKQKQTNMNHYNFFTSCSVNYFNENIYIIWNYTDIENVSTAAGMKRVIKLDRTRTVEVDLVSGKKAIYAPVMTVISKDGTFSPTTPEVYGNLISNLYSSTDQLMAVNPNISFIADDGIIVLKTMGGLEAKRYQFSKISFK